MKQIIYEPIEKEDLKWIRTTTATRLFGIGRSALDALRQNRTIKWAKLGNEQKSTVLINYESLAEYVESCSKT